MPPEALWLLERALRFIIKNINKSHSFDYLCDCESRNDFLHDLIG